MAVTRFSPMPGNFGEEYITATHFDRGAAAIVSTSTTRYPLVTPSDRLWFKGAKLIQTTTVAAGTTGLNATVKKRLVGGTFVAISNTLNVFGRALWEQLIFTPLTGIAEGNFCLQAGEEFVIEYDNVGGTITTQPQGIYVTAKLAVLR